MSVISGIVGPLIQSGSARNAARVQERAVMSAAEVQAESLREAGEVQLEGIQRALDFEREIFDIGREDLAPFREAGTTAVGQLAELTAPGGAISERLGESFQFGAEEFGDDPGRAFRLQEGQRAIERAASARGSLVSGGQLRDLTEFSQELGAQEFGAARGRALQDFVLQREGAVTQANLLAQLAGLSQVGTGVAAGAQFGTTGGQALLQAANVQGGDIRAQGQVLANRFIDQGNIGAARQVATANAIQGGLSQIGQTPLNLLFLRQAGLLPNFGGPTAPTTAPTTAGGVFLGPGSPGLLDASSTGFGG